MKCRSFQPGGGVFLFAPLAMLMLTLASGSLVALRTAEAQQVGKVRRIGVLAAARPSAIEAFQQGLHELGWVEGQNITFESRSAEGERERLPALAAELVQLQVDLIVAMGGTPVVRAAKEATSTIPIVMATGGPDPVRDGLVASLARPGGNVTGVSTFPGVELAGKRVELLKEALPQVLRVAVLAYPGGRSAEEETRRAAQRLGLEVHVVAARGAAEFDEAFATMTRAGAEALIVLPATEFNNARRRIVDLVTTSGLPAIYEHRRFVDAGGLMSYGPNLDVVVRRAAFYVDRILQGIKPADLPVEQPERIELVVNLKTAQALGLTLPPAFLFQADEVRR